LLPDGTPAKPDLFTARRVLCIQPHYDDNDLFAGGTIAALHDRGAEILYLTVTDDLVGVLDQTLSDAQMVERLRAEQAEAGAVIGVDRQEWLGYPDAGPLEYYALRRDILRSLRRLQPDFVLTVDPWLPYEAHQDHILTGRAAAEAVLLAGFPRLKTDPESDRAGASLTIQGIGFYNTAWPNLTVAIDATLERKRRAVHAYHMQFSSADFLTLERDLEAAERAAARGQTFARAEQLKIVQPAALHGNTRTWQS
jgi:N,N'-diacetylchitobiose non-reducing end deacetylase